VRLGIVLVLLAAASLATAEEEDPILEASVEIESRGAGVFDTNVKTIPGTAKLVSARIRADWWRGPSDDRAGVPAKARKDGLRFQLHTGRAWRDLPPIRRNLRLEGEVDVPAELVSGRKARGRWRFRQAEGDEQALRLVLTLRFRVEHGTPGMADLVIAWFTPTGRTPPPEVGVSLHDRSPVMRVEPGATIAGEALIRNIGHAEAFKNEWSVTLRPWSKRTRGGRKLLEKEISGLRERTAMGRRLSVKIPARTKPGEYALVFTADSGDRVVELDERNNALYFPVIVVAKKTEK
jgi:hypothetical protein